MIPNIRLSRLRWYWVCATAAMVASITLLHIALRNRAEDNWIPVQLPYPGAGYEISRTFPVRYGGRFEIQILTPRPSAEASPSQPKWLPTQLTVEISSETLHATYNISAVRRAASTEEDLTFVGKDVMYLPRGLYDVRIFGGARNALFTDSGSTVQVARIQHVGQDLFYPLVQLAAYLCLAVAAFLTHAIVVARDLRGGAMDSSIASRESDTGGG